mgnify:CR=1 FL=1
MNLTTNFNLIEFQSKDGSQMPPEVLKNIKELAEDLQVIRDYIKKPIHINSAYRSPEHNKKIGGKRNSYHIKGMAADITVKGYTPRKLYSVVRKLRKQGKIGVNGIGLYNGFLHIDLREQNRLSLWDNSSWYNFW